jgi:hypothetical protein
MQDFFGEEPLPPAQTAENVLNVAWVVIGRSTVPENGEGETLSFSDTKVSCFKLWRLSLCIYLLFTYT